ncbi:MAG: heat-inducible transcriptional repressor HrcA [Candidatus Bipolaricaulota bacterium]|nr:heat-inducible transcriptional repressor HrcA [Candidatus Bipolaricaulota bacterium]MCS7273853.1 heat-inducible transcriptional repressor HrcA [Candidatus Bipolaricaulota bacterium]MDW8110729.1 heat-inducible transcriptional repressor HrcA [Candidatus Bipolaricaulota bacterium]MDW8328413.1 heat-inducible transcriptional repressor HrcA [Candidatus Bipolaricaulota bacterium]
MDQRKRLILKEIVDYYIKTGEPVSSQTLLEKYNLSLSSATIRNEMKDLEKMGYLKKSWSSSGRLPTAKGIRFFVDWLLELSELSHRPQHALLEAYGFQRLRLDDLFQQTAFLLASLTGHLGFVLAPRLEETELEAISLTKLDDHYALAILITNLGIVESKIIKTALPSEYLAKVARLLNRQLRGRRLGELSREIAHEIEGWSDPITQDAFLLLREILRPQRPHRQLYLEGLPQLLRAVLTWESALEEVRRLLSLLEDEARLAEIIRARRATREGGISALIGEESGLRELERYSLIYLDYGYGGALGLLGPLRMDYSRSISTTQYIGNRLRAILSVSRRRPEEVK